MKNIIFLLGLMLALHSCQSDKNQTKIKNDEYVKSVSDFPKLLDRNPSLYYGKEWDAVQRSFVSLRDQIIKDQKNHEAKIKLAELFIQEARITGEHPHYYPLALELFNAVTVDKPNDDLHFRALSGKATVQLSLHDFTNAMNTAFTALQINPHNAYIYGALVDANVELGHYDKAIEYADKMVAIRPDLRSYSRISYLREIHGLNEESVDALKMAIQSTIPGQDDRAWSMVTLAELLLRLDKPVEAENVIQRILSERENFPFAIAAQADLEIYKNNLTEAEVLLKKAIDIIPEVGFYTTLAQIYKTQNRNTELETIIPQILTMMKEDADKGHFMDFELAKFHEEITEDYDKALQYALIEYNKRPENIDVNRCLASIYSKTKNYDKAKTHFEVAKRTGSKHPELHEIQALWATL